VAAIYKSVAGQQAVEAFYRKALERWPVPHHQVVVPTREGSTFVVVSGNEAAPPVVLLHGSGANSAVWIRDVAQWSQRFRVYAVDVIGEPGFSAPSRPSLRTDAYAYWLDDVFDQLGLAVPNLVGVSLGGWLALDYAIRRPARAASLSLLSPSGIGSQNRWFLVKAGLLLLLGRWGRRRSLAAAGGAATVPNRAAEFVMTVFQHFRPRMESMPVRTDAELSGLMLPVQVVIGGKDALIRSIETRDRVRRLITHADVTYLNEAGHILPPQTDAVAAFLMRASGGRTRSESLPAPAASSRLAARG